ncbi:hypothetical protein JL49_20760 [Pseudoalteromonas luteoviolacea]|nr:hypothetical protein JL49_20760 [Pseudoalteromonas luteoviolacea]
MKLERYFWILLGVLTLAFLGHVYTMLMVVDLTGPITGDYLVGPDESLYYRRAIVLHYDAMSTSLLETFATYHNYTKSLHWGNYYFLATMFGLFGVDLKYIAIFKAVLFCFFSLPLFYLFMRRYVEERVAFFFCIVLAFYAPFIIFLYSLLRDDLIFFLVVSSLFMSDKIIIDKKWVLLPLLFASLFLLFGFRVHMGLAVAAYITCRTFLELNVDIVVKRLFIFLFSVFVIYNALFIIDFLIDNSIVENIIALPITVLRLLLSPLPWQIADGINDIIRLWYIISFPIVIILSALYVVRFKESLPSLRTTLPFFALVVSYILPYASHSGLGFRQSAIIIPFLFGFIIIPTILYRVSLKSQVK